VSQEIVFANTKDPATISSVIERGERKDRVRGHGVGEAVHLAVGAVTEIRGCGTVRTAASLGCVVNGLEGGCPELFNAAQGGEPPLDPRAASAQLWCRRLGNLEAEEA